MPKAPKRHYQAPKLAKATRILDRVVASATLVDGVATIAAIQMHKTTAALSGLGGLLLAAVYAWLYYHR